MRVAVLADTHVRRGSSRRLPEAARAELLRADVILHAGDVLTEAFLGELAATAPTHAVLGNNDHDLVGLVPETLQLDLDGARVAMIHDAGPRVGREARMSRRFPDADLVVFGHSHVPFDAAGVDGQRLLNPGSATERRGQPHHTMATFDVEAGRITGTRIVVVGP